MRWTRVGEMIPNSTRTGGRSCRFVYVPSLCFGLCVFGTDLRRRTNEEAVQRVNKYFTRMPCPLKESSNGTLGPEGKGSSTLIRISGRARIALPNCFHHRQRTDAAELFIILSLRSNFFHFPSVGRRREKKNAIKKWASRVWLAPFFTGQIFKRAFHAQIHRNSSIFHFHQQPPTFKNARALFLQAITPNSAHYFTIFAGILRIPWYATGRESNLKRQPAKFDIYNVSLARHLDVKIDFVLGAIFEQFSWDTTQNLMLLRLHTTRRFQKRWMSVSTWEWPRGMSMACKQ